MRNIRIIVITILVFFSLIGISYGADTTAPMSRNQAQNPSDIHPGESVALSAQGRDDVALDWAWLSTNESGTWQNITNMYGSPMNLGGFGGQWVWTNFTWQNPTIPQGAVVGWRITYQDTEGNTNQTNIMNFRVLGNPPTIPQAPEGPGTGTIGGTYDYSVVTTDPDGDTVAYFVDWGDESQSIWTSFVASGTPVALSHSWQAMGTYAIKVKAKDVYGAQTSWSSTTMIVIYSSPLPALTLTAPSSVVEGASFDVTVTSEGTPMNHALVRFEETTLFTNSTGKATFIAPEVMSTSAKSLSAQLSGYQSIATTITVLDTETPEETKGWVYGWVANTTGGYLKNARVCIFQTGDNTTALCGFTDTQGRYNFQVLPGVYTIEASIDGYETVSQINVIAQKNYAFEVNLILQSSTNQKPSPQPNENRDLIEAAIHAGIASEKIAGELNVQSATNDYSLTVYKQDLTAAVVSLNQSEVMMTVTATDSPGTIFVVRLYGQQNVTDVAVAVDGASITQVGFSQIFEHEDTEPAYARVIDTSGEESITYCLVYLPHFSSHEISITTIMETVQAFGGIIAVAVYIACAVIVMVVLIMPVIMIERKRP